MDNGDIAHLLADAAAEMHRVPQEQPTFDTVVATALTVVPSATEASITVRGTRRGQTTLAATSTLAGEVDQQQYALGEGPCLTATDDGEWVRSGDVAGDPRWPRWGPQAAGRGVGSVLSIALTARGERIGALTLYAGEHGQFSDRDEVELALLFAVHAAQALSASRLVSGLEVALTSRHHIGVAQGIIMERYGVGLDRSFEILRRISSQTEVRLSLVARHVVETNEVPTVG
jgi:GAF domain-containing protein